MDTETVLQIISMLDARIEKMYYLNQLEDGALELMSFRDYLQEYIELQVAQVEHAMNQGE